LPKLSKILNSKYTISDYEIKKMLYMRHRTMHRQWRVKITGNEKINKRRMKKNTEMAKVRFFYNKCNNTVIGHIIDIIYFK
jgi:hypothetical protein